MGCMTKLVSLSILATLILAGCAPSVPSTENASATTSTKEQPTEAVTEMPAAPTPVELASMVGQQMPDFELSLVDGKSVSKADLSGKVVLLDYWASWCSTCKAASPTVNQWQKDLGEKGFQAFGVNALEGHVLEGEPSEPELIDLSKRKTVAYQKEHGYEYQFALYGDKSLSLYGFKGVPAFVLIDRDGTVVQVLNSGRKEDLEKMGEKIAELVEKPS